jgi:hypothetical protein
MKTRKFYSEDAANSFKAKIESQGYKARVVELPRESDWTYSVEFEPRTWQEILGTVDDEQRTEK